VLLIVSRERQNLRLSKISAYQSVSNFAWLKNLTWPRSGVSNRPNTQLIDLPNSNADNCCAAQWHATTDQAATTSDETSRVDFARQFGGKSDLF